MESITATIVTFVEDRQNFRYTLPWDYRMAEKFSLFTRVPYLLVWLALTYNLKVASPSAIQGQMKRHGDKSDQKLLVKDVIRFQRQMCLTWFEENIECHKTYKNI